MAVYRVHRGRSHLRPEPWGVNWDHSLARGLVSFVDEREGVDLVRQRPGTFVGTARRGVGHPLHSLTRGYGTTFGVGSTDSLTTALTTHALQRSYFMAGYRNGSGGGGLGRLFDKRTSGAQVELLSFVNSGTVMQYIRHWTSEHQFHWNAPAAGAWRNFAVTYDTSSTSNRPVFYIDGIDQGVPNMPLGTPTGTLTDNADAYVVGNRTNDNARSWDGMIGPFLVWNRILSAGEVLQLQDPDVMWSLYWVPARRVSFSITAAAPGQPTMRRWMNVPHMSPNRGFGRVL